MDDRESLVRFISDHGVRTLLAVVLVGVPDEGVRRRYLLRLADILDGQGTD